MDLIEDWMTSGMDVWTAALDLVGEMENQTRMKMGHRLVEDEEAAAEIDR